MNTNTNTKAGLRKPGRKWHGECIYKVREISSPIHKDFRGLRLVVAIPNMAGHKAFSSTPAPSFNKGYLLFQSSDYNSDDLQTKLPQHIRWLLKRGFEKVTPAEEFEARMLVEMTKSTGAQHVEHQEDAA
jgi:hypothetical protein